MKMASLQLAERLLVRQKQFKLLMLEIWKSAIQQE